MSIKLGMSSIVAALAFIEWCACTTVVADGQQPEGPADQAVRIEEHFDAVRSGLLPRLTELLNDIDSVDSLQVVVRYCDDTNANVRLRAFSLFSEVGKRTQDEEIRKYVLHYWIDRISMGSSWDFTRPLRTLEGFSSSDFDAETRALLCGKLERWREVRREGSHDDLAYRSPPKEAIRVIGIAGLKECLAILDDVQGEPVLSSMDRTALPWHALLSRARLGDESALAQVLDLAVAARENRGLFFGEIFAGLAFIRHGAGIEMMRPYLFQDERTNERSSGDTLPAPRVSEVTAHCLHESLVGFPDYREQGVEACRRWMHARPPGFNWEFKR